MATPQSSPPPCNPPIATLWRRSTEPRDEVGSPSSPRRPERDQPLDVEVQRWLDLSG